MSDRRHARHARPPARQRQTTLLALLLAGLCPLAGAETSPWYLGASQAFAYDSNLYRIDENVQPTGAYSRSDTISTTSLVGGIDQPIGRQRVFGSATVGYNRYSNNDYLNNTSYSMTAGLDWSTVERFSGNVNLSASQNQRRFNLDTTPGQAETRKNNESVEQIDAVVRTGVVTRLTLEAGLGYRQVGYSADEYANSEYDQTSGSLGVRYRPGIATFGASYRHAQSNYKETSTLQVNDNTRDSLDLTVSWPASAVSNVYLRLSPTQVRYDDFTDRDFTGVTGALSWDWRPTGKLKVGTRLVYDLGQDSAFERFGTSASPTGINTTARTTTDFRLNADYEATAKINLTAALGASHRSLDQGTDPFCLSTGTCTGSDNTTTFSLGARWTPLRSTQVGCSLGRDQRSAKGGLTQDYNANTVSCYGQFTLQ